MCGEGVVGLAGRRVGIVGLGGKGAPGGGFCLVSYKGVGSRV